MLTPVNMAFEDLPRLPQTPLTLPFGFAKGHEKVLLPGLFLIRRTLSLCLFLLLPLRSSGLVFFLSVSFGEGNLFFLRTLARECGETFDFSRGEWVIVMAGLLNWGGHPVFVLVSGEFGINVGLVLEFAELG